MSDNTIGNLPHTQMTQEELAIWHINNPGIKELGGKIGEHMRKAIVVTGKKPAKSV